MTTRRNSSSVQSKLCWVSFTCLGLLAAGTALGQAQKAATPAPLRVPQITSVFPAGAQRGKSAEIEVKGKNLAAVTDLHLSNPGVKVEKLEAKGAERLVATVAVEADAEPGIVELRAVASEGISNLKLFRIDELPELTETSGKNDRAADAQEISYPAVVNGQLGAADVDCYLIHVRKTQRLVFEVESRRLGSPANVRLRLLDSLGRFIVDATTTRDIRPDERIDHEFTEPGDYVIAVEDSEYAGGDVAVYRLRVGTWPYAASMFPLGGRRGESVQLKIEGGSLPKPVVQNVAVPNEPFTYAMQLQFPDKRGVLRAPMLFALGDDPEVAEKEPNDDPATPQQLEVPVVVNGRIDKPGDKDRFRFQAKKGDKVTIEVLADRLGSALDSVLTLTDKSGKVLAENDDIRGGAANRQQNQPAGRSISDSRIDFVAPADGEFVVTLDDRYNSGGPEFAYRLSLAPTKPDFALTVGPPQAQQRQQAQRNQQPPAPTDVLNLEPGKSATVAIGVERRNYDGPIELTVEGLPEGVTAAPVTIPTKQAAGQVTIQAAAEAKAPITRARIIGTAKINDAEVKRLVRNEIVLATLDPIHVARRDLSEFALAVVYRQPPLALKSDAKLELARGLEFELKVTVERSADVKGPVTINAQKLPAGIAAAKATIAEGQTEGVVKLTAKANAALGDHKVQLVAQGKSGNNSVDASSEVALAVIMPFELSVDTADKPLELVAGESQTLKVGVKRLAKFDAPIELAFSGLPPGVTAAPAKVEPNQDAVELTLTVADTAKPNKAAKPMRIQATTSIGPEKIKVESQPIEVTVRAPD